MAQNLGNQATFAHNKVTPNDWWAVVPTLAVSQLTMAGTVQQTYPTLELILW
jgi:hypothetical protein